MGDGGGAEEVFICRCEQMVKDHHLSIACDICDQWYHVQCVGMSKKQSEALTGSFMCKSCSAEGFMVDGDDWHVESASSIPLPLPESSSSDDDASSDEDEDEERVMGTSWGRVVYDNGSSFWGELHDGSEYLGAFVEAGRKGKAKMVKWEERQGKPVMLKILWEDIDYAAAQEARKKAQAAVCGDGDDGDGAFMYDEDADAGDGTNADEYDGANDDDQDADETDEDDDLQLDRDAPEGEKTRKKRSHRDTAQPGSKRTTTSSSNGPAAKKRRAEKQQAKARAQARAEAALRKAGGPAELQKLRTRVVGKLGEALEVNKAIAAKALAADRSRAAAPVTVTTAEQQESVKAEAPDIHNRVENNTDDEAGTVRETRGEEGKPNGTPQGTESKVEGLTELAVGTNETDNAASTQGSAKQEEAGASEGSEDTYCGAISSKILATRASEIEVALYELCGNQVSMQYKQAARNLAHNLADVKNDMLRIGVLKGEIVGATLVRMNASELANPDAQKIAQRIEENKLYHSRKVDEAVKDGLAGLELPAEYNRAGRRIGSGAAEQAENEDVDEEDAPALIQSAPRPAFSLTARLNRPASGVRVAGLVGSRRFGSEKTSPKDAVNHRPQPKDNTNSGPKYVPAPAWKPPSAAERAAAAEKAAQTATAGAGAPPPPPAGWDDVKYSEKRQRWYYRRRSKKPFTRWVTDEEMASGHADADPDPDAQQPTDMAATAVPPSLSGEVGWTAMHSTKKKKWYIVNLLNPKQTRWVGASEEEARREAKREEDARLRQEQQVQGQQGVVVDLTSDVGVGTASTASVPMLSDATMYGSSSGIEISRWLQPPQGIQIGFRQYAHLQSQYGQEQQWSHGPAATAAAAAMYVDTQQQPLPQYGQQPRDYYQQQQPAPYHHQQQQWRETAYQQRR